MVSDKAEVSYRPAEDPSESCGKCEHGEFSGSSTAGTCVVVAGKIDESFVCDRFEITMSEDGGAKPPFPPKKSATSPSDDGNPFGS
jgi:hypothetical protein